MSYSRVNLTGLALMENEGVDRYLYVGSEDGKLFEVQFNRSRRDCALEAETSTVAEPSNAPVYSGGSPLGGAETSTMLLYLLEVALLEGLSSREGGALDTWGIKPSRVKQFAFRVLSGCADKFSEGRRIGEKGAFGKAYRGSLDGKEVAVKVMTGELTDIKRSQFVAEVNTLSGLNHANLVQLVGYCVAGDQSILVYPFFRGGNMHGRLFSKAVGGKDAKAPDTYQSVENPSPPLTLLERMSIAFQVAKGLGYLHDAARPPIIHRDIKSSNILLGDGSGEKLHVVVADFGLAAICERVLDTGHDHVVLTSHIGGTFGGYVSRAHAERRAVRKERCVLLRGTRSGAVDGQEGGRAGSFRVGMADARRVGEGFPSRGSHPEREHGDAQPDTRSVLVGSGGWRVDEEDGDERIPTGLGMRSRGVWVQTSHERNHSADSQHVPGSGLGWPDGDDGGPRKRCG
ncbi:hypothetical protein CBR_g50561 [Chara braunii]|uniref:non-specific serine/threonine protein kinase n=1 Tax=Chara braunii TaxID=69332 RepID=A0A388M788_CHABU|nr:hypothetical protein CBR_g50561 [Chara braunii]|eukprot:GBG90312.1 hypothetical protein CBR_g50561 [Chara braunii]